MDSDLTLDFIIIIVLIIANGLFSMTELAIVNAKKRNLEEMAEAGNERAKKAYAVIATGETAIYANILLKKGVVTNE